MMRNEDYKFKTSENEFYDPSLLQHKAVGRFSDSVCLYELSLRNHIFNVGRIIATMLLDGLFRSENMIKTPKHIHV